MQTEAENGDHNLDDERGKEGGRGVDVTRVEPESSQVADWANVHVHSLFPICG